MQYLIPNGRKVYFSELLDLSYRDTVPVDGYEAKTLEFCSNWLSGLQEVAVQTSGSTGLPKTIVLKRSQLEASAKLTADFFKLKKGDKVLVCLNTEMIGGLMMLVRGLVLELEMTIIDPVAHPLLLFPPESAAFDFVSLVPYQLEAILNGPPGPLEHFDHMKAMLLGGAPLPADLEQRAQQLQVPVYQSYGMTETCSHIALRKVNGPDKSPYYTALPGVKIALNNKGCLAVSGPMTGGETIETNDLAVLISKTTFRLLGRADDVINSGGVKVHPDLLAPTVQQVLGANGLRCRFAIVGLPHLRLGQQVALVLELPVLEQKASEAILQELNNRLPKFEAPRQLLCYAAFPETSSGKINKPALLQSLQPGADTAN